MNETGEAENYNKICLQGEAVRKLLEYSRQERTVAWTGENNTRVDKRSHIQDFFNIENQYYLLKDWMKG